MVESTRPGQTRDPFDRFDEAISDPRLYETSRYEQPYELPYERSETLQEERLPREPVPLFLSSYDEESYQPLSEYAFASGHRKRVRVSRIVTAAVAVSAWCRRGPEPSPGCRPGEGSKASARKTR